MLLASAVSVKHCLYTLFFTAELFNTMDILISYSKKKKKSNLIKLGLCQNISVKIFVKSVPRGKSPSKSDKRFVRLFVSEISAMYE
jgi:hypothetical protein